MRFILEEFVDPYYVGVVNMLQNCDLVVQQTLYFLVFLHFSLLDQLDGPCLPRRNVDTLIYFSEFA